MSKRTIPFEETKQVAHYIAQKSIVNIGSEETDHAINKYLEVYNKVLDKIEEYNSTC